MTASVDSLQTALADRYTIERELGRGGMATVYLARDLRHERLVALKVLRSDLGAALGPERFTREIKLAAGLQHPHIVSVHDSGATAAGQLWFTMPYVEGESLRARLDREKQLPLEDALKIAREVADALDYAHQQGIIHRDIKPENILLSRGHALVADFGVARAIRGGEEEAGAAAQTLTETGMALGTPTYMSPEQATGERTLDARTDVYALGCVLYEMLAGEPPYTGATAQVILAKRVSDEVPSVRRIRPAVTAGVDLALTKALAPVPADRFATAADFTRALESAVPSPGSKLGRRTPIVVGIAAVCGLMVTIAVYRSRLDHRASTGPPMLAVLPFENQGDSADAYFAAGMTDEVRSKLTALAGLQVIASGSSNEYRRTTKTPDQIGRELGVRYLLVGRVRWDKSAGSGVGQSRVRVEPELVQVADVRTPTSRWAEQFEAPLTNVFQVQADIAKQVARALEVTLTPAAEHALAARPTKSLDAYDAYLKGNAINEEGIDTKVTRRAAAAYRQAIQRDTTFALAWAALSQAYDNIYDFEPPNSPAAHLAGDSAHITAVRARALDPDLPEAHAVLGTYYATVLHDNLRGLEELSAGLALAPNNAALITDLGIVETTEGRWTEAVEHQEQLLRLDPRGNGGGNLGFLQLNLHHYPEARAALDREITRNPSGLTSISNRAAVALAEGDLAKAQAVFHAALSTVDTSALVEYAARVEEIGWALDSAEQRVLLSLGVDAFDNDTVSRALEYAQEYAVRGNRERSRAYADTARRVVTGQLRLAPRNAHERAQLALALAYMGRAAEAAREGELAVTLPTDALLGPYVKHQLVRVYILAGEPEKALDVLEPLLKVPYYLSPGWLRVDPNFAPLRSYPRFERLIVQAH